MNTDRTLDPRNIISDAQLAEVVRGKFLWILQADLAMKDLRRRHKPFMTYHTKGIVYAGVVIALGYDRSDAFLYNAGTPTAIRAREKSYRSRRAEELRMEIRRLQSELDDLVGY